MKKLVVQLRDGFVNIQADRMEYHDEAIFAYQGDWLVGYFDVGYVNEAHLNEKGQTDARL